MVKNKKKVCIIGSGIAGVTTALKFVQNNMLKDYDVTVIDYMSGPGLGTSYGPAALTLFRSINNDGILDYLKNIKFKWRNFLSPRFYLYMINFAISMLLSFITSKNKSNIDVHRKDFLKV